MEERDNFSTSETIDMSEFQVNYLSLRVGETIPQLTVKAIKKVTNPKSPNNLPGVDYKYLIVSTEDEVLTVNSWVFWNSLKRVIQEHKALPRILALKHPSERRYEISVIA